MPETRDSEADLQRGPIDKSEDVGKDLGQSHGKRRPRKTAGAVRDPGLSPVSVLHELREER